MRDAPGPADKPVRALGDKVPQEELDQPQNVTMPPIQSLFQRMQPLSAEQLAARDARCGRGQSCSRSDGPSPGPAGSGAGRGKTEPLPSEPMPLPGACSCDPERAFRDRNMGH
jgi:hypothetical protein